MQIRLCPGPPHGRWFTISWRRCAIRQREKRKNTLSPEETELTSAMRQAIQYQCGSWRRCNVSLTSSGCGQCASFQNLQVDHVQPFSTIKMEFLAQFENTTRSIIPTEFGSHRTTCARIFLKADAYFKRKWQLYHAQYATYQILCRTCNASKGCRVMAGTECETLEGI